MTLKFCGFNGYQQFLGCKESKAVRPTVFETPYSTTYKTNILFNFLWSLNIYAYGKTLVIGGFLDGNRGQINKVELDDDVQQICCNEKLCLILLKNDKCLKYDLMQKSLSEIIFRSENNPAKKRTIFGEHINSHCYEDVHTVTHIACCFSGFVAITSNGSIYCLPDKIFQFPSHMKIKNLVSGFEHFLVLNNNGDVYSWGNGSRGQLGNFELDMVDSPKIIDALAGIKIIYISAGGWHSAAISAFGDLYVWGSNSNGQLGINFNKINILNSEKQVHRNPTLYPLPEVIDIDCNCYDKRKDEITNCSIIRVQCGARHTVAQLSCGRIYGSGWNACNQLGIINNMENNKDVDNFILLETINFSEVADFICGAWCTVFMSKENTD